MILVIKRMMKKADYMDDVEEKLEECPDVDTDVKLDSNIDILDSLRQS